MAMFTGLNTMIRGLYVNQTALNTTGHNITNADTEGYSRQQVNVITTVSERKSSAYGVVSVGTGAEINAVVRCRDIFADVQYRDESATMSYYEALATNYDKMEVIFNEADGQGLQSKILSFYKSWVDLSTEASNASNRVNTIEQGKNLSDAINTMAQQVQEQIDYNYYYMQNNIDEVNDLLESITKSNKLVVAFEATGATANDIRDQRDLDVDRLATYIPVKVHEDEYGNYQITSGGTTLVNGVDRLHLECARGMESKYFGEDFGITDFSIIIKESDVAFLPSNGTLKANLDAVDHCKTYLDSLANLAGFLLTTFNDQHKQGYDITGDRDKTKALTEWVEKPKVGSKEKYYEENYFVYVNKGDNKGDYALATDTLTGEVYYKYVGKDDDGNYKGNFKIESVDKSELSSAGGTYDYATDTVQVPNTINFFGEDGATYEYSYNEDWGAHTVTVTHTNGTREVLSGAGIINALMINERLNGNEGYMYVAAATAYDDSHDYSEVSSVNGIQLMSDDEYYSHLVDWGERTGDGNNAVYISELFNMSRDTILTAGRANAHIVNKYGGTRYSGGNYATINSIGGQSINSFYNSTATQLAIDASSVDTRIGQQDSIMTQVQNWRDATAGVDWNEELTNMLKYQKAFVACSRCLNAMDECLDRLANSTGAIGR